MRGTARHFPKLGRAAKGLTVAAITTGIVADFLVAAGFHVRSFLAPPSTLDDRPGEPGYPTIIPIGGIWERWDFLYPLVRHLSELGYRVHVVPGLHRNRERLDVLADRILEEIRSNDLGDVVLVGHSKGGLVGKATMLRARPSDRVRGVVAISTPYGGSELANLVADDEEVTDLQPSSRQTLALERLDRMDDRIINLASTFDEVLGRSNTVRKAMNAHVDRVGHFGMLPRRDTHARVAFELSRLLDLPERFEAEEASWPSRLRGRLRDVVRDYGFAVGWQVRSLVPDHDRLDRWRHGDRGLASVVLLPGVFERWPFMTSVGERLHRAGHAVHVMPELGLNARHSEEQAVLVADAVERLGLGRVVLVAHSKGGLIGKRAMLDPRVAERIDGMVAVSTPFEGSEYARLFAMRSVREFSPRGRSIRSLSALTAANDRIVSIWAVFDQHIPTSSALDGALWNRVLPVTGHFRLLGSGVVLDAIEQGIAMIVERADELRAAGVEHAEFDPDPASDIGGLSPLRGRISASE